MQQMPNIQRKQQGFTLIEIAIVLVIIGLLLGGVLQGQQLIENSRIKKAANDFSGIVSAVLAYQDRYGKLPGDDGRTKQLRARGSNWAAVTGGDNDGKLEVKSNNTFNGKDEGQEFFQHLKASGFLSGNPADKGITALPNNSWNGKIGVTSASMGGGLNGNKVCMSEVPGLAAIALDNQMDDGKGATGSLRATIGKSGSNTKPATAVLSAEYTEDDVYTLCYRI